MTDWHLVRELVTSAIDACEQVEKLRLSEVDRMLPTGIGDVSVWDVLQSAWIYPENSRSVIARARDRLGEAPAYRLELARVLEQVGSVAAELVGAERLDEPVPGWESQTTIREQVERLDQWYSEAMVPQLSSAAARRL